MQCRACRCSRCNMTSRCTDPRCFRDARHMAAVGVSGKALQCDRCACGGLIQDLHRRTHFAFASPKTNQDATATLAFVDRLEAAFDDQRVLVRRCGAIHAHRVQPIDCSSRTISLATCSRVSIAV